MKKIGRFLQKILYLILIILVAACVGILIYSAQAPEDKFKVSGNPLGFLTGTASGNDETVSGGEGLTGQGMTEGMTDVSGNSVSGNDTALGASGTEQAEVEEEVADAKALTEYEAGLLAADRTGLADKRIKYYDATFVLEDATYYIFGDSLSEAADGGQMIAVNVANGVTYLQAQDGSLLEPECLDERTWQKGSADAGGVSLYSKAGNMEIDRKVGTGSFLIQGVKIKMNFGEALTQIYANNGIYDQVPSYTEDQITATASGDEGQGRDALLADGQMMFGKSCRILYDFNKDISGRVFHVLSPRVEGIKVMFTEDDAELNSILEKMELMLGTSEAECFAGLHTYNWYLGDEKLQLRARRSSDGSHYVADAISVEMK